MKIISLYQPYATLCVMPHPNRRDTGVKLDETRGWSANYRGRLGIHATAKMPGWCKDLLSQHPFNKYLKGVELPTGAIIGTVELISVQHTTAWMREATSKMRQAREDHREQDELYWVEQSHFGDFSDGRYAWRLANPILFERPIPAKGSQGFWEFDVLSAQVPELRQLPLF